MSFKVYEEEKVIKSFSTLNYVRKCCKYIDESESSENAIDPKIFLEEKISRGYVRSRSSSLTSSPLIKRNPSDLTHNQASQSPVDMFRRHNHKHIESCRVSPVHPKQVDSQTMLLTVDSHATNDALFIDACIQTTTVAPINVANVDESQKRHVQFRFHNETKQSSNRDAPVLDELVARHTLSAVGTVLPNASCQVRSAKSAPLLRMNSSSTDSTSQERKTVVINQRARSNTRPKKYSLKEFRLHPENFLSTSNRYLPLLLRQAAEIRSRHASVKREKIVSSPTLSHLSETSDTSSDDVKSFLSEETEFRFISHVQAIV
jgi:hypothetical protein